MEIAKIAAVGIVAAVLAITLRKTNPEISLQVSLAAGVVILLMSVEYLREAVRFVHYRRRDGRRYTGHIVGCTRSALSAGDFANMHSQSFCQSAETPDAVKER